MKEVVALPAQPPRSDIVRTVAWVYAGVLTVMALGQLFSFEEFMPLIEKYGLPGGHGVAVLVACVLVFGEIFALPFLLRMRLSPLMRWFSLSCGAGVALIWLLLGTIATFSTARIDEAGLFGTKLSVPAGSPELSIAFILAALAAWSIWGLWPARRR